MRDRRQWLFACEDEARQALAVAAGKLGSTPACLSLRWDRSGAAGLLSTAASPAPSAPECVEWFALSEPPWPAGGGADNGADRSDDLRLHRDVYRHRDDVAAVILARPVCSTALACTAAIRQEGLPVFLPHLALMTGDTIRCAVAPAAAQALPERALPDQARSDHVLAALGGGVACLLADRGLLVTAASLQAAVGLTLQIEQLAQIHCQIAALNRCRAPA